MKKILLVVGAILAVALLAVLVVPALIDWSRYRTDITARLEEATGRDVRIEGDVGLRLLPAPTFTAERVVIGNIKGRDAGSEPFATAESLNIRLRLAPLLRGDVAVDYLALDRPVINLVRLPDGRVNWDFSTAEPEPATEAATQPDQPAIDSGDGTAISLNDVRINRGVLTYQSPGAEPIRIDAINAKIQLGSLSGPFAASGSLRFQETAIQFDGALDRIAPDRGSPGRLALTIPQADASLSVSGMLSTLTAGPTFRGRLIAEAPQPARVAAMLGIEAPPLPPGLLRIDGALTASSEQVTLSDMEARLGESRAAGRIDLGFGDMLKVDAALKVAALNLDAWMEPAPAEAPAAAQPPVPERGAQQLPPPLPPAITPEFVLPQDVFVDASLAIEALSWQGAVIEEVRVEATLDQGELVLRNASARLPGNSATSLAGTLFTEQGRAVFEGQAEMNSDNFRALLDWAGADVSAVPADRLRRLDARTALHADWPAAQASTTGQAPSPPTIQARDLSLAMDSTRAKGSGMIRMTERPFYGLDLAVDAINLDAYLPEDKAAGQQGAPPAPAAPQQQEAAPQPSPAAPSPAPPAAPLTGFDADIRLAVNQLVVNTVPAETVRLEAALTGGTLTIRQASADLAGSKARIAGSVLGLGQNNPRVENLTFAVDSPRPERLFRFLGMEPPVEPARLGQLSAQGRLDGDFDAIRLETTLRTGGMEARAQGSLASPLTGARYSLAVQATHPSFTQFVRLFSPTYRPAGGNLGTMQASANVIGGPTQIQVSDLVLNAGPARLNGAATIGLGSARPLVTADLVGNAITLDPFLPADGRTGFMLPVPGGLRSPPGAMPGPAQHLVPAANGAPGPWSREALDLSAFSTVDAKVGLTAPSLAWGQWLLEQPQLRLVLDNGAARLEQFTGRLLGGTLDATAILTSSGIPSLSGTLAIDGANLARANLGAAGIAVTQGRFNAETRFQTQGRSTHDMAASLQGQGRILAADGIISGFDLPAISKQLNNIENIGNLLALVQTGLSRGQTPFSQLAGTFNAQNGVITTRDTRLDAEGGTATLNADIRLAPWTMTSVVSVQLADSSAPPVHIRLEGPIDNPRRIFDLNALQQHLAARGLGRALRGTEPGRIIEDLLGGGRRTPQQQQQQPADPAQPAPEQAPAQPEKVIRDLLKGLIR